MAYDQNYYQPPPRPGYGRGGGGQRTGPPQDYQPHPPQQYPAHQQPPYQQQYDQYAQHEYAQDQYGGHPNANGQGYADDWNGGYQDANGGGRGGGYPPQQRYPPQQQYHDMRGPPPPGRAPRGPYPDGRGPPPPNGYYRGPPPGPRGGGFRGGYAPGRGGRPPSDRHGSSDPGRPRVPMKSPPISPNTAPWDNPFPSFPGAKKKTSMSEEQEIIRKMSDMDMQNPQPRPRTASGKSAHDRHAGPTDDYGYPATGPGAPLDDNDVYLSSAVDNRDMSGAQPGQPSMRQYPPGAFQRPAQNRPPPPQQQPYPQRGASAQGFAAPSRQNTYDGEPRHQTQPQGQDEFGLPARSMTMPTQTAASLNNQTFDRPMVQSPPMSDSLGSSAPYNGPIGRGPPRPATAGGSRPIPHRTYPDQLPNIQPHYPNQHERSPPHSHQHGHGHSKADSVSDVYDQYYDPGVTQSAGPLPSPMPDFDSVRDNPALRRRGNSIDVHIQPGANNDSYNRPLQQHGNPALAQPQAAVFENAGSPSQDHVQTYDSRYDQHQQQAEGYRYDQGPQSQNPPRSASAAAFPNGLPNGPRPEFAASPAGPRSQSLPHQNVPAPHPPPPNPDALPNHPSPARAETFSAHPTPVRPGLMSSPQGTHPGATSKPAPVRHYDHSNGGAPPAPNKAPQPIPQQLPPPPQKQLPPAITMADLDLARSKAKAMPNDHAVQLDLAKKLIEGSDILVGRLSDPKTRHKTREKFTTEAHKILKKLVGAQHSEAMFTLADCHGRGAFGGEADTKEAFTLYQNAAKAGHAGAAYRTAVCCELGSDEGGGTRKDPVKAIQWYRRAATLGDTPAMYKMGMILLKGLLGQAKNPHEAVVWLKRAAERADAENPHALHELAMLYDRQPGPDAPVQRDPNYAFELFNHAADLGYKFSQFRLGTVYEYGLFNQVIDPRQSIMWYSRAAVQEEHQSEMALSGWYLTGADGILQQSDTEAYLWARKAALAGLAKAEYAMGYFTELGIGAPANLDDAKRWYWRAAAQNFPKAREKLEDLKRNGNKATNRPRERISRSKVGQQNEGECTVM